MREAIIVGPHPGMHAAHGALQEHLVRRPVQMMGQSNWHADGQRQHAAQITRVAVMVLQPPAGTGRLVDAGVHIWKSE